MSLRGTTDAQGSRKGTFGREYSIMETLARTMAALFIMASALTISIAAPSVAQAAAEAQGTEIGASVSVEPNHSDPVLVAAAFGWWTKCWAIRNNTTYIDTKAQNSRQCHKSLKRCTGSSNITSHFRTSPVLQSTKRVTKCR